MRYAILFALLSTMVVSQIVIVPNVPSRSAWETKILGGGAPSPYRYRVLVPIVGRSLQIVGLSHVQAYSLIVFFSFFGSYFFFGKLLTHFQTSELTGMLILSLCIPMTLSGVWFDGDYLELFIFAAGLWLTVKRKYEWLLALLFVGMFNRDQTIYLAAFLTASTREKKWLPLSLLTCLTAFAVLRITQGYVSNEFNIAYTWAENLWNLDGKLLVSWSAILILPAVLAFRNYAGLDIQLKRWMLLLIPYAILFVVNANAWELAKFLPAYLIMIPAILNAS